MTAAEGLVLLIAVLFVGSHIGLSTRRVRRWLIDRLGERGFRGFYSVTAVVFIVWLAAAYNAAPQVPLWVPPTALKHLSLGIMPFACILLVAGYSPRNPTVIGMDGAKAAAAGPYGIFRITRHPVMWAVALWGISHVLANGELADLVLFGAISVLALFGARHIDRRKHDELGAAWAVFRSETSFVPFVALLQGRTKMVWREIGWWPVVGGLALYGLMLATHTWLFGVNPFAL
jgi:uncharacterized membrane protein